MPAHVSEPFDPTVLPPQPQIIPDELRLTADNTNADWQTRVPPQAVGMFIAAVTQWLSNPRFGVKVEVDADSAGWTIRVGLPQPDLRNDVIIGDAE